tara:strand:- start:94 stop:672 length:579 start_codon:yes stop_codon:yes gene_type:complete
MLDEFDMQSGLLLVVVVLILIILFFVYRENSKADEIKDKISNLKMECPGCPECPDVSCPEVSCPDNPRDCPACPDCPDTSCPKCPSCPDLPNMHYPTVNEIIDGIFPGRNQGVTLGGDYFPLQAFTESCPIPGDSQINELPVESNAATVETDTSLLGGTGNIKEEQVKPPEEEESPPAGDIEGFLNYLPILH